MPKKTPMDTKVLLSFIGKPSTNRAFDSFLTQHRIYDRPATFEQLLEEHDEDERTDDEFDEYGVHKEAENSLIIEAEHLGCCLIFAPRKEYELLFGPAAEPGEFIFKEAAFYAQGVQDYQQYSGTLPGNLAFGDTISRVPAMLQRRPTVCRMVYDVLSERYEYKGWILNIGFSVDRREVLHVRMRSPHRYDLLAQQDAAPEIKDLETSKILFDVLGSPITDLKVQKAFSKIGLKLDQLQPQFCPEEITDLEKPKGVALYFRDAEELQRVRSTSDPEETWFVGFRFKRCGDLGSEGYWGELPHQLAFHDSSQDVLNKIGKTPDASGESDQLCWYMWKFERHILHAMCSKIDDQLYRVTLFAPFMEKELFSRHAMA